MRSLIRRFVIAACILTCVTSASAQGIAWYTIPLPVPGGFADVLTGNIHLEIPFGPPVQPQRSGDSIKSNFTYDSTYYSSNPNIGGHFSPGGPGWYAAQPTAHSGTASFQTSTQDCTSAGYPSYPYGTVYTYSGFYFQDSNYQTHAIVNNFIYTKRVSCQSNQGVFYGSGSDITSTSGAAADGSGYSFTVSNYTQMRVYAADGWLVYDSITSLPYPMDLNGNYGSQPNTSVVTSPYGSELPHFFAHGIIRHQNLLNS